jgi:glycerophosphoryl diester phosphodiesterase
MDENSNIGGASMAVAPDGRVLANLYSKVGIAEVEFDPHAKYYKPAGFGNPPSAHWEYIEKGRRPWKYRSAGPDMIKPNDLLPYPRTCAHRGFNSVAPENSMPAFGAAVAMGAEEIEFDLWDTVDHEIVSTHDSKLDRVSDGTGKVYDHTYDELLQLDFGKKKNEAYSGMKILRFEEILQKFAGKVIMNVHIKTRTNEVPLEDWYIEKLIALIDKYDCRKYVYFMTGNDTVLAQLRDAAPDICRCTGGGKEPWRIVDRAIELGCSKVQLFKPYFNQEMIDKAHANGILCNVFYADDVEECERFLDMGIDCILTNDYNRISQIVAKRKKYGGVL